MLEKQIESWLSYAKAHLYLQEDDEIYLRNLLFREFGVKEPYQGEIDEKEIAKMEVPDVLIEEAVSILKESGMEEGDARRRMTYVFGLLSPLPSKVRDTFFSLYEISPKEATDYLYDLSVKNDYVAKTKVDRNIVWDAHFDNGPDLEMSINLSKPEKSNKDIAKLVHATASGYPSCVLCKENEGYEGSPSKAARGNIRIIPLDLGGERWYLQFSPYGYYKEHCILFYEKHVPMEVSRRIVSKLFDFVDLFPHYFMGSNSDLPIVGGSILNHEHFQGGEHLLPVIKAKPKYIFENKHYPDTEIAVLSFYDTVICLKGKKREEILDACEKITLCWRKYDDVENQIIAVDKDGLHATVTNIARKDGDTYELYMILRNNRCDETYPTGIFHAHPEYAHIKSEGIGLIEAAGRFILPARLARQGKLMEEIVSNGIPFEKAVEEHPDLSSFQRMYDIMKERKMDSRAYMNEVCQDILRNVAVFKDDEKGQAGLRRFLEECDL